MKRLYFLFCCFFFFAHSIIGQKIKPNENLFKEMWISDTCGEKGYRLVISSFVAIRYKKGNLFKTKKDILFWLGEPNKVYSHTKILEFCYIVEGDSNCSLDLEDTVLIILSIYIDKKNNKVVSITRGTF